MHSQKECTQGARQTTQRPCSENFDTCLLLIAQPDGLNSSGIRSKLKGVQCHWRHILSEICCYILIQLTGHPC